MSVDLWMVPVVLAGVVVFGWASTWFEGLVAPLGYDPELRALVNLDTAFTEIAPGPAPLDTDCEPDTHPADQAA